MVLTDLVPLSVAVASPWNDRWYEPNEWRNPLGGHFQFLLPF
jgi:hypothetical protein